MSLAPSARAAIAPLLIAIAMISACIDIPTETPTVDQRWVVAGDSTTLNVERMLPTSVTVNGGAFVVALPTASVTQSVADFCAQCRIGAGAMPKPAFVASLATTLALPADVARATLVSGTVVASISNTLPFDPIRPSATARGTIVISIINNGVTIGSDSIDGTTTAVPPNARLDRTIALRGGATISGPIDVSVRVTSPDGDPATFTPAQGITASVAPSAVRVSRATVLLNGRMVTSTATTLDLSGVGAEVRNRVQNGALLLAVTNPFAVGGTMSLTVSGTEGAPIVKAFRLDASSSGSTEQRVEFTRDELRAMLGQSALRLVIAGPVTGAGSGGAAEMVPLTQAVVSTKLDVALRVGGN